MIYGLLLCVIIATVYALKEPVQIALIRRAALPRSQPTAHSGDRPRNRTRAAIEPVSAGSNPCLPDSFVLRAQPGACGNIREDTGASGSAVLACSRLLSAREDRKRTAAATSRSACIAFARPYVRSQARTPALAAKRLADA